MNLWQKVIVVFCHIISFQGANAKPIVPFSLTFRKVSRSLYDDSNASIGPGIGGSPILVDTRHRIIPRYMFLCYLTS